MANEFKHKDPGSALTQAEFIASDGTGHIFDGQAAGDVLYASSTTVLKNLAKATDGNVLELASGLPAWTGTPTIGSTSWSNANHAHGATNSGGTLNTSALGAGTLAVGRGGTGITSLGTNVATFLGTPSSANLRSALTDETGTGGAVFATSPTLATPALGTPSALVLTSATGLPTTGIVDDAVTLAKMADITRGSIIYGNASGDPAALAKGTEDYVLTAGADDIAWAAAGGGGNLEAAAQGLVETGTYSIFTALGPFPIGETIDQADKIGIGDIFTAYEGGTGTIVHSTTVRGGWDIATSNNGDVAAIAFGGAALQISDDWTVVWRANISGTLTDLRLHMGWTPTNPVTHGQDNDDNQIGFRQTKTANMFAVVDSGGTETTHDHGSNINTTASYRIEIREGGSEVTFYINNSVVGSTITSGVPSSSAMYFNINVDGDGSTDAHVHLYDLFAWREV